MVDGDNKPHCDSITWLCRTYGAECALIIENTSQMLTGKPAFFSSVGAAFL